MEEPARHLDDICRACLEQREPPPLTHEEEDKKTEFSVLAYLPDMNTKFYAVVGSEQGTLEKFFDNFSNERYLILQAQFWTVPVVVRCRTSPTKTASRLRHLTSPDWKSSQIF